MGTVQSVSDLNRTKRQRKEEVAGQGTLRCDAWLLGEGTPAGGGSVEGQELPDEALKAIK